MNNDHFRHLLSCSIALLLLHSASAFALAEYTPPTEVSLIIDGTDVRHFRATISQLQWLVRYRKVKAREIIVVGLVDQLGTTTALQTPVREGRTIYDAAPAVFGKEYSAIEDIGLPYFETLVTSELAEGLELKYSPVWIVHHFGRRYVFEGWTSIRSYFDAQGTFHIRH